MSWRLAEEVLDHAPADLSSGARLLLVALAHYANDNDRTCWPGMENLIRRTGMTASGVRAAFAHLALKGLDPREAIGVGVGKDGQRVFVFAHTSKRTTYRIPRFPERRVEGLASSGDTGESSVSPLALSGDTPVPQRRHPSAGEVTPQSPPSVRNRKGTPPLPPQSSTAPSAPGPAKAGGRSDDDLRATLHALGVTADLMDDVVALAHAAQDTRYTPLARARSAVGPVWVADLLKAARTTRDRDAPRCLEHPTEIRASCRSCAAERKGVRPGCTDVARAPSVEADAVATMGADLARQSIREARERRRLEGVPA